MALTEHEIQRRLLINRTVGSNGQPSVVSFTTTNLSGAIARGLTPQDLTAANPNCDRITVQNLDFNDVLVIGIGEDAQAGRSYEIDPRGVGVIEEGEAQERISVMSAKTGLQFVAIARIRN